MSIFTKKVNLFTLYLALGANVLSVILVGIAVILFLNLSAAGLFLFILVQLLIVNGAVVWGVLNPEPDKSD